jgi:hypothetical protein
MIFSRAQIIGYVPNDISAVNRNMITRLHGEISQQNHAEAGKKDGHSLEKVDPGILFSLPQKIGMHLIHHYQRRYKETSY